MTVRIRTAVRVEGIVQGVGFRPFVYGLATRLGLGGLVGNDADGVFAEIEGDPAGGVRHRAEPAGRPSLLAGPNRTVAGSSPSPATVPARDSTASSIRVASIW